MSRGNKLTRSPRHQFLPPVVAVKWAHVQKTKLPNKIANDVKLRGKPAYDRPRASLPPKRTNCERLMLKENDASTKWAGGNPPEVAAKRHLLLLAAR